VVYADKGEWDRAIEMYEHSLETFERVGDVHGIAQTRMNLALVYLETGHEERARPFFARAYLIFSQLGSSSADTAAKGLVRACGSAEAADAYLAQIAEETPERET
jgi:tetratricopeptide (TPR) repeat protein